MVKIQKNILFIFLLSWVGYSCSMELIKPYMIKAKNTLNGASESYVKATNTIEQKLHLPKNSLKIGIPALGTAALAAKVGYTFTPPETVEKISQNFETGLNCATYLAAAYNVILLNNWRNCFVIKNELSKGFSYISLPQKQRPHAFRFFGWAQQHGVTAHELYNTSQSIIQNQFKIDATCSDKLFINGKPNNPTQKNPITSTQIKKAILDEFENLKSKVRFAGNCTNALSLLSSDSLGWNKRNSNWDILDDMNIWKHFDESQFQKLEDTLKINAKKMHWFKKYIYSFPGWRFWDIHIAPNAHNEQIELFIKLLKACSRLLIIKNRADNMGDWQYPARITDKKYEHTFETK